VGTGGPLHGFLEPRDLFIPVPRSLPQTSGHPSAARWLAEALVRQGVGAAVWCGLRRLFEVPKSATAAPGCRPTVHDHYYSLAVDPPPAGPARVVLIDDVITKGRTVLAATARVREAFPNAQISAFVLLRTMGFVQEVDRFLEPCVGEIRWISGDALRDP
jgi:predicted amidophosphoribosyltransferase